MKALKRWFLNYGDVLLLWLFDTLLFIVGVVFALKF